MTRFCNDWTQSRNATWIITLRVRRSIEDRLRVNSKRIC